MPELLLHPVLPMFLGAILVRVLPRSAGHVVMVLAPLAALASVATLSLDTSVTMPFLDYELEVLRADALARPFGWIFCGAALIAGIYGMATQRGIERTAVLTYAGAALGVVYAGDLLTLFLFWEIKAISSTFVILSRRTAASGRAALRYLFVHIAGGKILLIGILFHLGQTGSLEFSAFEPGLASSFVLVAFLINAAVPPLHAWLADGYPQATVAGTVFLSAFTTKAAVYALARGFPGFSILIYLGVLMALYGVVYAVLANDIRRLLSYHIVSQVGFMVTAVGIGTPAAINGATAHAFAHILYKALLLMGVGAVLHATGRSLTSSLGGIGNRMRAVMALYMVGAVSISSFPLFSGFVSKEIIVDAAAYGDLTWLVYLLKIASVGTFLSTGLKLPYGTWIGKEGMGPTTNDGARLHVGRVPATMMIAMGLSAGLNLLLGVVPDLLYRLLPYQNEYVPYRLGKVLENGQVLLFTALGFLLVLHKLTSKRLIALDTDWLYRRMPDVVRSWFGGGSVDGRPADTGVPPDPELAGTGASPGVEVATADAPSSASSASSASARASATLSLIFAPRDGTPPVAPTWALGGVVVAASVLFLALSLLP